MDFFSNVGTDSKKAIENESLPQQVNTEVSSPENLDDNFSDIKIPKKITAIEIVERYDTDKKKGLTSEQVKGRYSEGLINGNVRKKGRSVAKIIFSNTFTFFNMIYLAFGIAYIAFAQWKQLSFLFVIVANTLIAIIQEIKSKRTLEKLNLVNSPTVKVIRDGKSSKVRSDSLVLDDIQILENGNQITADSVILEGAVEVNEAVLTGESESVYKKKGETLFAGSYITSSSCVARVDKIAKYNYIESLSDKAKMYRKPRSEMLSSLRSILIGVAIIVLPMMFFLWQTNAQAYNGNTNLIVGSENFIKTLNTTAGAIISMIPAGPFLLTSVALAVSVIRLAKHKTMVQELYCIEMLARVNVLCLDKTGTITDGTMRVVDCIDVRNETTNNFTIKEIMCALLKSLSDNNMTSIALKDYFGIPRNNTLKTTAILPFSSNRKLSAVSFGSDGTYILGAPEYVMKTGTSRISELTEKYAKEGYRVLLLAYSSSEIYEGKLPTIKRPVAVIVIEDHIRPDAGKTIDWFKNNGVAVKVISGDNPISVANIAMRVGVENADRCVSLEGLSDSEVVSIADKYTVFGRVTPEQKALLITSLKTAGNTVAMTGDGVNDILAMRESDCSIAMAGGSDAARNVSHLVLLDNSFSTLPDVVSEGRRVVNNIQSATSMYFMKTIYIILLNLMIVIMNLGFHKALSTPFTSMRIILLEMVIVGLPTTLLALQPNTQLIKGRFLNNVLSRCFPASLTFIFMTLGLYIVKAFAMDEMSWDEFNTIISIAYVIAGYYALFYACKPFNNWKRIMYAVVGVIVVVAMIAIPSVLDYATLNREEILLMLVAILGSLPLMVAFNKIFAFFRNGKEKIKPRK